MTPPAVRPATGSAATVPARRTERAVSSREAARRITHVAASIGAAVVAWTTPPAAARLVLTLAFALALAIDLARRRPGAFARVFDRAVGSMLRPYEHRRWAGATVLAAGFAIAAWVVPPATAAVAFLIAGLADPAASAVGRRIGRFRTRWGTSVAGTSAFVVVGIAVVAAAPGIGLATGGAAVLAAALVEAAPFDDNLTVPVVAAVVLHLLGSVA